MWDLTQAFIHSLPERIILCTFKTKTNYIFFESSKLILDFDMKLWTDEFLYFYTIHTLILCDAFGIGSPSILSGHSIYKSSINFWILNATLSTYWELGEFRICLASMSMFLLILFPFEQMMTIGISLFLELCDLFSIKH